MIIIRKTSNSDESKIKKMLYHAIHVPEGRPPFSESIIDTPELSIYYKNWGKIGDSGYLAVCENKIIGAVWIRLFSSENKGYGYISNIIPELSIAIIPEFRNKGIGTDLMKTLFNDPEVCKYKTISLSVSKDNKALSLYKRFGFEVYSEDEKSYIMSKELGKICIND
ncbi:MAG: GNAT family N-acetyltransferase [Spirochaetes bacterium]|nr:GNAT family N-acetyltransferase [Spirochaetota bacterium]